MAHEQSQHQLFPDPRRTFSAAVQPDLNGGWRTEVDLGDGATLTKWFPTEVEAQQYPEQLASWLSGRARD
jgi:hypothetical protein